MKRRLLFIAVMIAIVESVLAQRTPTLSLGLQGAQPIGEFANVYNGVPFGLSGNLLIPVNRLMPIEFGGAFTWNSMGSKSEEISVYIGTDEMGDAIYENGTLYLNSNANRFAMVGRLRPFNGMIQPYGDLSAGIETFRTKTTINVISDNTGYSEGNNAQTQQFDMTVFYSWAAGMRIRMTNHLFLDMRFENLVGGSATYVDGESVVITSEEEISFNTKTSKTDKYTYTLGLSVSF
ncbi:MAG: hypothetical protein RLZZ262_2136 [Bacteroidota bacterium]|jgi:hypothetical protein